MDNVASINNHKPNYFDFDLTIEGLSAEDAEVRFVIKYKPDFCLTFSCEHQSGSKWSVEIPPLKMLDITSYNFAIEVIVDGYYFEGMRGMLNVVGAPQVFVNKEPERKPKIERPMSPIFTEKREPTYKRKSEQPIANVAKSLSEKTDMKKPTEKTTGRVVEAKKPVEKKVETKKPVIESKKPVEKKADTTPLFYKGAYKKDNKSNQPVVEDKKPVVEDKKPVEKKDDKVISIIKETEKKPTPSPAKKPETKKPAAKKPATQKVTKKPESVPVVEKKEEKKVDIASIVESVEPKEQAKPKKKIAVKKGETVVR